VYGGQRRPRRPRVSDHVRLRPHASARHALRRTRVLRASHPAAVPLPCSIRAPARTSPCRPTYASGTPVEPYTQDDSRGRTHAPTTAPRNTSTPTDHHQRGVAFIP
jgi:hypothetical protein